MNLLSYSKIALFVAERGNHRSNNEEHNMEHPNNDTVASATVEFIQLLRTYVYCIMETVSRTKAL